MNSKASLNGSGFQRHLYSNFLTLVLLAGIVAPVFAEERYIAPGKPDGIALLAPPPAPGSTEASADLASARAVFKARTSAEESRATKDATLSIFNFSTAIGPSFQAGKFPKTE